MTARETDERSGADRQARARREARSREIARDTTRTRWVVSPYVHEVSAALIAERVPAADGSAPPRVLYDLLNERLIALTAAERARVTALVRGADAANAPAFAPERDAIDAFLARSEVAMRADDVYRRHNYRNVEIEINRHCNLRCRFCPVSTAPKPRAFMSDETYRLVLDRAVQYGVETISLNHYSEPSLCRDLVAKIASAGARGLGVRLYTNASLLTTDDIDGLAAAGNLVSLVVNLPAGDPDAYRRVTGTKFFDAVATRVVYMARVGLPVRLSINAPTDQRDATVAQINARFGAALGDSVAWPTDSRAGSLDAPDYAASLRHAGALRGCIIVLQSISVSWDGRVFLCCQDYDQDYVLGDLRRDSLRAIADTEYATALRRDIFGGRAPERGFLCTRCEWTETRGADTGVLRVGSRAKDAFDPDIPDWDEVIAETAARPLLLSPGVRSARDASPD